MATTPEKFESELPNRLRRGLATTARPAAQLARNRDEVALLLMHTYEVERRRHDGLARTYAAFHDPTLFARDFGKTPAGRRRKVIGNVEDNPDPDYLPPAERDAADDVARDQRTWTAVATIVISNRMDPEQFVRRQFMVLPAGTAAPSPEAFKGSQAVANYRIGRQVIGQEIAATFRSQVQAFQDHVGTTLARVSRRFTPEESWEEVLSDEGLPLSPLFRYCMAVKIVGDPTVRCRLRFRRLADRYLTAAAVQYVFEGEVYEEVWKTFLPPGWAANAAAEYRAFYGF